MFSIPRGLLDNAVPVLRCALRILYVEITHADLNSGSSDLSLFVSVRHLTQVRQLGEV